MSLVFQNIDPPPPPPPGECVPPPLVRGEDTLAGGRKRWGVNILEDARHSSVLYTCKYFGAVTQRIKKPGTLHVAIRAN
jgi:hypothetical protein